MRKKTIKIVTLSLLLGVLLTNIGLAEEKFFELKAKKFSYTPNVLKVNKGDTVKIRLLSEDVHHGFYLDGYGVRTSAQPGKDGSLTFVADRPGRFTFRCSITCGEFHPYMVGHLRVSPNVPFKLISVVIIIIAILAAIFALSRRQEVQKDEG